jgi:hypothetical protein
VPLWKPAVVVLGQPQMLSAIYENGHLTQLPIVVPQLDYNPFPHLQVVSCADRQLLDILNQLLGISPHHGN